MDPSRPPVTVHGSSGTPVLLDLLDTEAASPAVRRRWPAVALALALAVAGLVAHERDRRSDAAEQRRLDGVAALSVTGDVAPDGVLRAQVSSRASLVGLELQVRNDGPRTVLVDRAVVGDFRFVGDVELDPGESGFLHLVRTVTCPADGSQPPLDPVAEGLRLQVVTAAGERSVLVSTGALSLDRLRTTARRACGYLPVEEAVEVMADAGMPAATPTDRRVPLTLLLTNHSVRHLHLLGVRLAPGLRSYGPSPAPLLLPGVEVGAVPLTRRLQLWVAMVCDEAPRSAQGELLPLPRDLLSVVLGDDALSPVGPLHAQVADVALVQAGYRSACS